MAARALGYAGLTLYESLVSGSRDYTSLDGVVPGLQRLPRASRTLHWPAVANAALATILRRLFVTTGAANQAAIAALESSLSGQGRTTRGRPRQHAEIEHGRDVARAIFAASRDDGGNEGYLRNFPADHRTRP